MIHTVLLDLDGTLIDSNEAHAKAWLEAMASEGLMVPFLEVRKRIGMGGDHLLREVLGLSDDSSQGQKISKLRGEIFRQKYLPHLKPFAGARELLEKLISLNFELIVASSAAQQDLKALLQRIDIEDLIRKTTSADDVQRSKPDPDIISAALRKTSSTPQEAVMLGDTPYDITAAAKAGVRTIAFTCGGCSEKDLFEAIAIYEGPWHLLREFENSPFAGNLVKNFDPPVSHDSQSLSP